EFWATAKLHHNSIHFKMYTKKSVLDLEAFREMLHISPRIPSQSFAELPSEEEILEFLRKPSIPRRNIINWHYVRDDVLFSTIKVEEFAKNDDEDTESGKGGDEVNERERESDEEETRQEEEESFDPIPRTPVAKSSLLDLAKVDLGRSS
nr:hypothetical protein [Tanacetum cinerariifolium]